MKKQMARSVLILVASVSLVSFAAAGEPTQEDPAALFAAAQAAAAQSAWAAAFDQFEAALTAEPDNLRWGTAYRQAVITAGGAKDKVPYERCVAFFEKLAADNPEAPNAWLNYGFSKVDKIPAEGAITQVILANSSVGDFTTALELKESWLGLYSRGHAYLFWPPIFGFAPNGVADLERAIEISQEEERPPPYYARAWVALGDGHWRLEDLAKARELWQKGQEIFPEDPDLEARLAFHDDQELAVYLDAHYQVGNRVETHLREIFDAQESASKDREVRP